MAKEKNYERIIYYGLVKPTKTCDNCERPNHGMNTHCWYCKTPFSKTSHNRNLQVTPSASPKEAVLPSVNSDISFNLRGNQDGLA